MCVEVSRCSVPIPVCDTPDVHLESFSQGSFSVNMQPPNEVSLLILFCINFFVCKIALQHLSYLSLLLSIALCDAGT